MQPGVCHLYLAEGAPHSHQSYKAAQGNFVKILFGLLQKGILTTFGQRESIVS